MTHIFDRRSLLLGGGAAAAALVLPACAVRPRSALFFERHGLPVGIQLYALGEDPKKDLEGTLQKVAAIGFRDIELPGLLGRDAAAVRAAADQAGLAISSLHMGLSGAFSVMSDAGEIARTAETLGLKQIVVPMFPLPSGFKLAAGEDLAAALTRGVRDAGEAMWTDLAETLNRRAAALKPYGISLGYHNHSLEFMPLGTRTGWDILAAETDPALVHFEIDVGWLTSAGIDPVAFFGRHKGRVRQLHVKDVKRGFAPNTMMRTDPTEVGSGGVDWARVLPAAYAAGARHFYFEQEPPFTMSRIEAAAKSFAYLAALEA